ncbi:hypothetical protein [Mesonia aestuariivivens]|uniref:Carboxypeptidase-like regulatory domain-containing protein n=1 Tax=Mesonia aestuariivivens TaxID=2796128 RepID=A0ABS6VZA7_9FLAO|nr:hypothetical protein [Mesonia aestuariivivens]MBW2960920.1 hypothetical protein [Mesonia aestuariivivens]
MRYYFLIPLFLISFLLCSQSQLRGKILADSIAFTQINIVNFTQEIGTVNAKNGKFVIDANVGDRLIFSSVQYEPYQITVTLKMLQSDNNSIYLFLLVNQLDEVNITDIDLTGDLNKDTNHIETLPFFNPKKYGLPVNSKPKPTTAQRRIYTASTGNGIIPLDPIINAISGRLAMVYRQRDYEIQRNLMIKAYNSRPLEFFVIQLNIPEDYVEDYLYYCVNFKPFRNLLVQKENTFKLSEFFQEKAVSYKDLKKLE